jgi:GNAT superfamily N-acetyltransferase
MQPPSGGPRFDLALAQPQHDTIISMLPEIRPASLSDLEILVLLMRQLQADDPWSLPFHEDALRPVVRTLLADPSFGAAYLVHFAEKPVGYIILCFDYSLEYGGKGAWVDEFFVAPEHRGQGIGTEVLRFAEEAARKAGATVLHLEVNHGNPAIELYRRSGFEDHQRYLMTKPLR